jgi:hypothetical protein
MSEAARDEAAAAPARTALCQRRLFTALSQHQGEEVDFRSCSRLHLSILKWDNAFGEEGRYGEKHRGLMGIAEACRASSISQREVAVAGVSSAELGGPGPHVKMTAHFCPVDWRKPQKSQGGAKRQ